MNGWRDYLNILVVPLLLWVLSTVRDARTKARQDAERAKEEATKAAEKAQKDLIKRLDDMKERLHELEWKMDLFWNRISQDAGQILQDILANPARRGKGLEDD